MRVFTQPTKPFFPYVPSTYLLPTLYYFPQPPSPIRTKKPPSEPSTPLYPSYLPCRSSCPRLRPGQCKCGYPLRKKTAPEHSCLPCTPHQPVSLLPYPLSLSPTLCGSNALAYPGPRPTQTHLPGNYLPEISRLPGRSCPAAGRSAALAYPIQRGRPLLVKLVICSARRHFLRCTPEQSLRVSVRALEASLSNPASPALCPRTRSCPPRAHTGSHARTRQGGRHGPPALRWAQHTRHPVTLSPSSSSSPGRRT